MASSKEIRTIVRDLRTAGFNVKQGNRGRWLIFRGRALVGVMPGSPGSTGAVLAAQQQARKLMGARS